MDSTGFSTGHHLHYGIKPLISKDGNNWSQCFKDNGFKGSNDPELYLPHIVWNLDEILSPEKYTGIGIYKPKGYKMIKTPTGYQWVVK
jgi:murein DD-endopeptidase MepM/ murein hydrolase activator NlpD